MKGDPKVIEYLNRGLRSELTAINQYWLHYRMLDNWGLLDLAKKWKAEAIEEMHHADRFVDRILFLEGFPNLQTLDALRIGRELGFVDRNHFRRGVDDGDALDTPDDAPGQLAGPGGQLEDVRGTLGQQPVVEISEHRFHIDAPSVLEFAAARVLPFAIPPVVVPRCTSAVVLDLFADQRVRIDLRHARPITRGRDTAS